MQSTWLSDLQHTLTQLNAKAASTNPVDVAAIDGLITRITRSMDTLATLSDTERNAIAHQIPTLMETITTTLATLDVQGSNAKDKLTAMRLRLQATRSYKQSGK